MEESWPRKLDNISHPTRVSRIILLSKWEHPERAFLRQHLDFGWTLPLQTDVLLAGHCPTEKHSSGSYSEVVSHPLPWWIPQFSTRWRWAYLPWPHRPRHGVSLSHLGGWKGFWKTEHTPVSWPLGWGMRGIGESKRGLKSNKQTLGGVQALPLTSWASVVLHQ